MTLVSPAELADLLESDSAVRILDVRWSLPEPDGRAAFEAGHIPGAVYVDLETELSDHSVPNRGRHPLPSGDSLEAALRSWGIDSGDIVVVYDDWNRAGSARAWWVLCAAGVDDVRILDGGFAAWRAFGGRVSTGAAGPARGSISIEHRDLYTGALATLTAEDAAKVAVEGVLLDARAPERFRGEVEPVDPVAGHIPGAANLPSTTLLAQDGASSPRMNFERHSPKPVLLEVRLSARIAGPVSLQPWSSRLPLSRAWRCRCSRAPGRSGARIRRTRSKPDRCRRRHTWCAVG